IVGWTAPTSADRQSNIRRAPIVSRLTCHSLAMRITRRRPSPAMVVALIALFVALGGPAQAKHLIDGGSIRKGTITSKQIKNGSVAKADLTKGAVRSLTETPASSVRSPQIADGQVLAPDLGA